MEFLWGKQSQQYCLIWDRGDNKFLPSTAGVSPLWLSYLLRCPCIIGMMHCKKNQATMRMMVCLATEVKSAMPCFKTAFINKKRQVIVIGDTLLQEAEGPMCCPDPCLRAVCCLPGARVKDVKGRLLTLVWTFTTIWKEVVVRRVSVSSSK